MAIIKKYYKGTFIGLFKKISKDHKDKIVFSKIHWSYLRIENVVEQFNYDIEGNKTGDYWFKEKITNKKGFHPFVKETEVFIPRGENLAYSGDIFNVLLKNLKFNFANGEPIPKRQCEIHTSKDIDDEANMSKGGKGRKPDPIPSEVSSHNNYSDREDDDPDDQIALFASN